jgi:hypothetical protein
MQLRSNTLFLCLDALTRQINLIDPESKIETLNMAKTVQIPQACGPQIFLCGQQTSNNSDRLSESFFKGFAGHKYIFLGRKYLI